jgi:hypothetical protein
MSKYSERAEGFAKSLEDAREHAENIASQVANIKALNRDPQRALFDKVNDSVGTVSGAVGNVAQIIHQYKHGRVTTFIERHEINQALGRYGNSGTKNAGNEILNTIDQARNAPRAGLAPNSQALQLPEAKPADLVSSLKGRIIGNMPDGAKPSDLAEAARATGAIPEQSDAQSVAQASALVNKPSAPAETAPAEGNPSGVEAETNIDEAVAAREAEAAARPAPAAPSGAAEPARSFLNKPLPEEGAGKALADAEQPIGSSILGESSQLLQPIKINTNAISGGEEAVDNLAGAATEGVQGAVSNVGKAANVAKSIGSTLAKNVGEASESALPDAISAGIEAAAPETGPIAPLVAAVGGLVALGSSMAKIFHKNKPPPPIALAPPPVASQIGANLSVSK